MSEGESVFMGGTRKKRDADPEGGLLTFTHAAHAIRATRTEHAHVTAHGLRDSPDWLQNFPTGCGQGLSGCP